MEQNNTPNKSDLNHHYVAAQKTMTVGSILLKYHGAVTSEVIDPFLAVVQHRLECIEPNLNLQKKVYSILMECAQNISVHTDYDQKEGSMVKGPCGYLSVESTHDGYQIISANCVLNAKRNELEDTLKSINNLDTPEDLKSLYNKVISNKACRIRGGAGLGLIDVARKSTGKLNYSFDVMNDDYSFFTLNVAIKK